MGRKLKAKLSRITFLNIPLIVFMFFVLAPFYWVINTSLKTSQEVFRRPITYWPYEPIISNYTNLFTQMNFGNNFLNSLYVAVATTIIVGVLSLMGGYAMSRFKFRGKGLVYVTLLLTQMFPAVVLMIPLFQTMNSLNLINNLLSLIIVCSVTSLPFCLFMMMGFYNLVPQSLEEAAQVDGASMMGAVFRVLLPVMAPSLVAVGAFAFINAWNVYVYAVAFITRTDRFTVPLVLRFFSGEVGTNYAGLAAAAVVSMLPVLLLFALVQKHLVKGATSGAVKG